MIVRIWHGYTTLENAEAYEKLLNNEIFVIIEHKHIKGYKGIQLLKREYAGEMEFITIMWFTDTEAVKEFAGEHYETAFVLPQAQQLLKRFDATSTHYELLHNSFFMR